MANKKQHKEEAVRLLERLCERLSRGGLKAHIDLYHEEGLHEWYEQQTGATPEESDD